MKLNEVVTVAKNLTIRIDVDISSDNESCKSPDKQNRYLNSSGNESGKRLDN